MGEFVDAGTDSGVAGRVLVAENNPALLDMTTLTFGYEGWVVKSASSGQTAQCLAHEFRPNVVVLDLFLPDNDGVAVMHDIRTHLPDVPVLFLSATDSVEAWLSCTAGGGNDYLTKPFGLDELVNRVRRLMPSTHPAVTPPGMKLVVGDLELDARSGEVRRGGDLITITATASNLLGYLMRNSPQSLSKDVILNHVWNYDFGGQSNVVAHYIAYLRSKIDANREPMIHVTSDACYFLKVAE